MATLDNVNEIFTRLQLKHDTYERWTTVGKDVVLLPGEIGICEIPSANPAATTAPTVLFKVGDGTLPFHNDDPTKCLKWASALAADVYSWAKKTEAEFTAWAKSLVPVEVIDNGTGKFVTDVTVTNDANGHHITITRDDAVNTLTAADDDVVILTTDKNKGDVTITGAHKQYNKAGQTSDTSGTATANGTAHTIKVPNIKVDTYGHVEFNGEVEHTITIPVTPTVGDGEIDIVANDGVELASGNGTFNVNQDEDKTITIKHAVPDGAEDKQHKKSSEFIKSVTTDKFGHVTEVTTLGIYNEVFDLGEYGNGVIVATLDGEASPLASFEIVGTGDVTVRANGTGFEIDGSNTAHTHSVGAGFKALTDNGGIDGDVKHELNLAFEDLTADNKLRLVDATTKTLIAEFDASEFVEDSYLESVTYSDEDGDNVLTFVFKLNDGTEKTVDVDLKHLVDVYTPDEVTLTKSDDNEFSIKDGGVSTAKIANKAITAEKLADDVFNKLNGDYKTKQTAANGTLTGAQVVSTWSQNANGEVAITTRNLTPADIGAAPADNYKTKQTAVTDKITDAAHVIESLTQNANGEISYTVKKMTPADIGAQEAGDYATRDEVANQDIAVLADAQKYTDEKVAAVGGTLATIATSGSIYDVAEGSNVSTGSEDAGVKYLIFNCGSATKVI